MSDGPRLLIVEARFYDNITDELVRGAVEALNRHGAGYKRIIVPGILEIPAVIRFAVRSMEVRATDQRYAGYIVLGCAIKGETEHYEHVCTQAMTGVQQLALQYSLAVGNGILTCPTEELALTRAKVAEGNHGGRAAEAALRMIAVKQELGL